ncbi:DUF3108 domain-containing protein [Sansalvadorimonas verongulae]|uniref:DUF3108 domain-containing protein n=1 Tax=Sansalvadorimonas verongulae TaxID=2172824 RepID=UPI0018AD2681|nr:DUF3108 domain-containing protein [Sansalvadorimonas verongulae]
MANLSNYCFAKTTPLLAVSLLAGGLLFSGTSQAAPKHPPVQLVPYEANYSATLSGVPINGKAKRSLVRNSDNTWTLSFNASMLIYNFDEESHFTFNNGKIQPKKYALEKGALGKGKSASVEFDWGKKFAQSRENEKNWKVPLQPDDLDGISYQQQLQYDVSAGLKGLSYTVIDKGKRNTYSFVVDGDEMLETPAGSLKTVRLKMVRKNKKRETWIWLAKDWNDLLVKLKQSEKGKDYIVTLADGTVNGKSVQGVVKQEKPQ